MNIIGIKSVEESRLLSYEEMIYITNEYNVKYFEIRLEDGFNMNRVVELMYKDMLKE